MQPYIKNSLLAIALGSLLVFSSSCNKTIEKLQTDPNNPTSVPPSLILGSILTDMGGLVTNSSATGLTAGSMIGNLGGVASWDAVHRWNQYYCTNYNYYVVNDYLWQSGPFDSYQVLKNVVQMEKEALSRGAAAVNPYEAIGKFVRAYYYYNLTSLMGDIPQASALEGSSDATPAYTPQKQVFQYILNVLDTANTEFTTLIANNDNTLQKTTQEIYYSCDLTKWQKLVNSFKLRVLVSLSNKATDADLNVPAQFANILNNSSKYPVFQSQADDFQFVYQPTYNLYYFSPANFGSIANRYNLAKTYVDQMVSLNDPRIFVTGEPATFRMDTLGYAPTDINAFAGSSTGEDLTPMSAEASKGYYSFINHKRYFSTYVGEPDVLVGYKEMCFNIAEAANRGWVSGADAETWYKKGIAESFKFYGLDSSQTSFIAYFQSRTSGVLGDYVTYTINLDFNGYYNQSAVKYTSGATGINQIVLQKYLAMFQNSGWEGYYNYRRTGVPAFQTGTAIGNNGIIPKRWSYPVTEQSTNKTNWQAALTNQQFTADDLNQTMWILKP